MNIIIHPDELFLKGSNQSYFFNVLLENLRAIFPKAKASRMEGGIWLENISKKELQRLEMIPGIANFAIAYTCPLKIEDFKKIIDKVANQFQKEGKWG